MSRLREAWAKDDLLDDIDLSIKRSMEDRLTDLTGALLRLNAATRGWCEIHDCGPCPIAVMGCHDGIDERVKKLTEKFHAAKLMAHQTTADVPEKTGSNQPANL